MKTRPPPSVILKAVGALARHLAEATWHVLSRKEAYKEPVSGRTRKA